MACCATSKSVTRCSTPSSPIVRCCLFCGGWPPVSACRKQKYGGSSKSPSGAPCRCPDAGLPRRGTSAAERARNGFFQPVRHTQGQPAKDPSVLCPPPPDLQLPTFHFLLFSLRRTIARLISSCQ